MPKATVDITPQRKELKSLPGGFVELKRMPFGQWLHRQELALQLKIGSTGKGRDSMSGELAMANKAVTVFEFQQCIVNHNLTMDDEGEQPLDFRNAMALDLLDAKVGEEIGNYINELHAFEQDLGNSESGSELQSF
jgi:hypothetical protein